MISTLNHITSPIPFLRTSAQLAPAVMVASNVLRTYPRFALQNFSSEMKFRRSPEMLCVLFQPLQQSTSKRVAAQ